MNNEAVPSGQMQPLPAASNPARPQRVAVIGVHGVAHHDPGATANAMADLLLSLPSYDPRDTNDDGARRSCGQRNPEREYTPIKTTGIQIPLQPICIDNTQRVEPGEKAKKSRFRFLQEGSANFAQAIARNFRTEHGAVGHEFTAQLLQDYKGGADGNTYVTNRLECQRKHDASEVHVYEMFWADLARPTNTLVSFLLALFQLILHIPSLSRLAIDTRPNAGTLWIAFRRIHRYAARMLQIFIPFAKVALLIVLFSAVPEVVHTKSMGIVATTIAALIFCAIGLFLMHSRKAPAFRAKESWLVWSFVPGLVVGGIVFALINKHSDDQIAALVAEWWFITLLLVSGILRAYIAVHTGESRGTAWLVYFGFYLVVVAVFVLYALGYDDSLKASLWTTEWLLVLLRLFWIVFSVLAILAVLLGTAACFAEHDATEKKRAFAAFRTSCFALALPAFLFVLVTTFIWAGLFSIARNISEGRPFFDQVTTAPLANRLDVIKTIDLFPHPEIARGFDCNGGDPNCEDYLRGVLAWSSGYGTYIAATVALSGLLILVWWAIPSVLTEKFPLRRSYDPLNVAQRTSTEPPRDSTNRESIWMGSWISMGLDSVSVVTALIWLAVFVIPLVFIYAGLWRARFESETKAIVGWMIAVAGTAAALTALVRYSSPVLRVILDVDTYLRTGPKEATPRAKIFERYASLLRYVAQYRDENGNGYDKVVIVAHSLGSLISADLLRFLHSPKTQVYDQDLSPFGFAPSATDPRTIPITLFTMGNPLRQLLNRFFPYLYDWVREAPDNRLTGSKSTDVAEMNRVQQEETQGHVLPVPSELGVVKWVNAYRSGDYVGRSLWLNEWYNRTTSGNNDGVYPEPIHKAVRHDREEFCIGAGAHTHYWDDTAPDIAETLDALI